MSRGVRVLGVIPARLNSTRLPRKVLRLICGRPMVEHVYKRARLCSKLDDLVVATDSDEVATVCGELDIPTEMTSPEHPSGTDRIFEVMTRRPAEIYVNIQGDEPLLDPEHLAALLEPFSEPATHVTTLRTPMSPEEAKNPNAVKVVCDAHGNALYFSRWPIPYDRDGKSAVEYWKHLGLYAYRRGVLEQFHRLPPSKLEMIERLEQLRFLENGLSVRVAAVQASSIGVDTEEDLQSVERLLRQAA